MGMEIERINQGERADVDEFLREHWFSTEMAVHGELIDLSRTDGLVAREGGKIIGLVTMRTDVDAAEILSLDSVQAGRGIGTALLEAAAREARLMGCRRLVLTTTNDNTAAIDFYRKRGFAVARVRQGAVTEARALKPEIPLIGENGVPITDEIDMEKML